MSEIRVDDLLSVAEAIALIDALEVQPRVEVLPLLTARGRTLAQSIVSDRDYPPFHKCLMDGYAVRAADVEKAPVTLRCGGQSAAGNPVDHPLQPLEAIAVMTGAPVPSGADCVVPVEWTHAENGYAIAGQSVRIDRSARRSQNIAPQGADVLAQVEVLAAGVVLEAAQIAVAASVGASRVSVFQKPRVCCLSTGDEIVGMDRQPGAGQIRNSNNPMLMALLQQLGCEAQDVGIVADKPDDIRGAIERGLDGDALFITGGMSMGLHDHVPRILREMGAELLITKLRIRPGKPFVLARLPGGKLVFGLPGNPVSAFVCTIRLAGRWLSRIGGGAADIRVKSAVLSDGTQANGPREFYQPAAFDGKTVVPLTWKGSADIFTLAHAGALIIVPENAASVAAGETVQILDLR